MKGVVLAAAVAAGSVVGVSPAAVAVAGSRTTAASVTGVAIDPGYSSSWPIAVAAGEVVGGHSVDNETHGFVWRDGAASDLGTWGGGDYSLATAINQHGDIVGESGTYEIAGSMRAVLWHDGLIENLGSLGGNSFADAINGDGVIVGNSELAPSGAQFRAVEWRNGVMSVLPTLSGSSYDAADLLDGQGDAAGYSVLSSGVEHAVLWTGGVIRDLGPGRAVALNNLGQVLVQGDDAQGKAYAFVWDHGSKIALPATVTEVTALNDNSQVAGSYVPVGTTQTHGFLWGSGAFTDLGTLSPVSLDDYGRVLASDSADYGLAYLWDQGTLTRLLPFSGSVAMPTAIDSSGLVAGTTGLDTATIWQIP